MLQNCSPLFPFKLGLKACFVNYFYTHAFENQIGPCAWLSAKHGILGGRGFLVANITNCVTVCGGGVGLRWLF